MIRYGFVSRMMTAANIVKHVRTAAAYGHQKIREAQH